MGQGLFLTHSTDRVPFAAEQGEKFMVPVGRFEVDATRQGRFARGERTRPIAAVGPVEIVRTIPAVAGGGKKETVAVNGSEK